MIAFRSKTVIAFWDTAVTDAAMDFVTEKISVEDLENEIAFYEGCRECEWCSPEQMCSHHFDKFHAGAI